MGVKMSKTNDEIYDLIVEQKTDMAEVKGDMKAMRSDLNHHIKRTDLLEMRQDGAEEAYSVDIPPLKTHVTITKTLIKVFVLLLTSGAAIAGIYKVLSVL